MARQPLASAPARANTGPASAPPIVGPPAAGHPDPLVMTERRMFIGGMLRDGHPMNTIVDVAMVRFGIHEGQVRSVVADLRRLMVEADAETKPFRQLEQLDRLRADLAKMRAQPRMPFAALTSHEKLIAEIEGNLAPRRIKHEVQPLPDALAAALAGMSAADVERIMREEREVQKKLAAFVTTATPAE